MRLEECKQEIKTTEQHIRTQEQQFIYYKKGPLPLRGLRQPLHAAGDRARAPEFAKYLHTFVSSYTVI